MFVIDLTTYHLITADHKHTKGLPMAPLYIDQIKSLTRVFEFSTVYKNGALDSKDGFRTGCQNIVANHSPSPVTSHNYINFYLVVTL